MKSVKNMIPMENVFNVLIIIFLLKKVINVWKYAKVFKWVFFLKIILDYIKKIHMAIEQLSSVKNAMVANFASEIQRKIV